MARLASETYRLRFGVSSAEPLLAAWAPGRINLIGEHTDYNEGFVLPAAVNRLVALAGRPTDEPFATLYSAHHQQFARVSLAAALETDAAEPAPLWARYLQAVWRQLSLLGAAPAAPGFSAAIVGDVPVGGGLSSSAALEVATAKFIQALGGMSLPPMTLAQACQRAEQEGAGVRVGVMDQAVACLGRARHAILLDCRTLAYQYVPARMPGAAWAIFDTRTPHTLAGSEYNIRRSQCEMAVALLAPTLARETAGRSVRALRDVTLADLARHGDMLDATLLRRARHVVTENARALSAVEALHTGDCAQLGALLNASHSSLRDDYAVSCAELDAAADIAQTTPGVWGARMIGAGFGGSILALVRREVLAALAARLAQEYPQRTGREGEMLVCAITGQMGAGVSPVHA